jgi:hypothetical protein
LDGVLKDTDGDSMLDKIEKVEKVKIVAVEQVDETVLVTFSDGRVTTLDGDDMHLQSEAPAEALDVEE